MAENAGGVSHGGEAPWLTPKASRGGYTRDNGDAQRERPSLDGQARNWATPTVNDSKNGAGPSQFTKGEGGRNLNVQVAPWRSPAASTEPIEKRGQGVLLNPAWAELLMGWPLGWTDVSQPCAGHWAGWPLGQGEAQYDYEPPRTVTAFRGRTARMKMLGNGVVPQCAAAAFARLLTELTGFSL